MIQAFGTRASSAWRRIGQGAATVVQDVAPEAAASTRRWAKDAVDWAAAQAQSLEHRLQTEPGDVVLPGFPRLIQLDGHTCGAQCAHMILRHFGRGRSLDRTLKLLGTDQDGTSDAAIRRLVRARGLSTHEIRRGKLRDLQDAIDRGAAVLVSVNGGVHFAVVYGYGRRSFYVADPSPKRLFTVVEPRDEFRRRWDGWGMAVRPRRR